MSDERDSFAIERARKAAAFAAKKMRPQLSLSLSLAIAGALAVGGLVLAAHSGAASHALERMHRFADARSSQAAAVSLSSIGHRIFELLCPLFGDCPAEAPLAPQAPSAQPRPAAAPPARAATTTAAVFATETPRPAAPAPSATPARASPPAPSAAQAIIERIVQREADAPAFDARLAALEQSLIIRMNQLAAVRTHQSERAADNVADQISRATTITALDTGVLTGKITNAIDTASAAIASLTATELVATNATTTNLHVSGSASLNGDLTVSGTLTANILNVQGVSSAGALVGPFVTATSSSATSTFAGGFSVAGESILATTTVNGTLTVNGNTYVSEGGQLTVGDKIIAPGEIGLGTSTPAGKLAIQSTDADQTALLIRGASGQASPLLDIFSGSDQSLLHLAANGNVGIGTTTPGSTLTVNGNSISAVAFTKSSGAPAFNFDTANSRLKVHGTTPYIQLIDGANASSQIKQNGAALQFLVNDGSVTGMHIGQTGNVGIGTTSPQARLHVAGNLEIGALGGAQTIVAYNSARAQGATLDLYNTSTGNTTLTNTFPGAHIILSPTASGNIGIGTTDPQGKLSVTNTSSGNVVTGLYLKNATAVNGGIGIDFDNTSGNEVGARINSLRTVASPQETALIFSTRVGTVLSEKVRIDANGNVGIGTTSPMHALSVYKDSGTTDSPVAIFMGGGSASDETTIKVGAPINQARLGYNNGSGGPGAYGFLSFDATKALSWNSSGNVGIGTTSPSGKLTVVGNSLLQSSDTSGQALTVLTNTGNYILQTGGSGNGRVAIGQADANTGKLQVAGSVTVGSTYAASNAAPTDGMIIQGNVGIGTTSPLGKLHIASGNSGMATINSGADEIILEGSGNTGMTFLSPNTATQQILFGDSDDYDVGRIQYLHASDEMTFFTANAERVRITNAGNVGIGTTTPATKLHVVGTTEQLRLGYDGANYSSFTVSAGGNLTINTPSAVSVGTLANTTSTFGITRNNAVVGGMTTANSVFSLFGGTTAANHLTISSAGNVGIGTTGPGEKLEVTGNVLLSRGADRVISVGTPTGTGVVGHALTVRAGAAFDGQGSGSPTDGGALYLSGGDGYGTGGLNYGGNVYLYGGDGTGGGGIDGNVILGHTGSASRGNVGIGTTSPGAKLEIAGGALSSDFRLSRLGAYLYTKAPSGASTAATFGVSNGSEVDILSLTAGGNVGIGTTSPSQKLEIAGSIYASNGDIMLSGSRVVKNTTDNLYLYSAVGKDIVFATDLGSEKARILNNGNVGIGTTGPNARLSLGANLASQGLLMYDSGNTRYGFGVQPSELRTFAASGASLTFGHVSATDGSTYSEKVRITNAGNVGIGTTNPNDAKVEVKGGTVCVDTDSNDSATSCIASESDERLKTNIQAISASSSLDIINALNPVSFDWRASDPAVLAHWPALGRYAGKEHSIGLIAQEVMPILPEALSLETVGDDEVQYYQLDYTKFVPHLIGAVKELWAKVQDLGQKVAALFKSVEEQNAKIQALEARVNALESQTGAAAAPSSPPPQEPLENGNSDNEDTESQEAPSDEPTVEIESPAENPESESAEEIEGSEAESTPESAVESEPVIENPEPADAPANE